MEKNKAIQEKENTTTAGGKGAIRRRPGKPSGPGVRVALGDLVQAQRDVYGLYKHVVSKVDSGLERSSKNVCSSVVADSLGESIKELTVRDTQKEDRDTQKEDRDTQKEDRDTQKEDRDTQKEDRDTQKEDRDTQKEDKKDKKRLCTPKKALPDNVEDIDEYDDNHLVPYIKDIYKYLFELELKYPIEPNHLEKQTMITSEMRTMLMNWLVEMHQCMDLSEETFHLCVQIIDRYLQVVHNVEVDRYQLIGVTAMFIASKYEEIYATDVMCFAFFIADRLDDMLTCEREILSKLEFCISKPIPLNFSMRFFKAAHGTSKHHHLANYFVDLSLVEYSMCHYRPSELAAAAICLSLHVLCITPKPLHEVWTPTLAYYSQYTLKHLDPIIRKMAKIVIGVEVSEYKAVHKKYMHQDLEKVSSLPHLKGHAIYELVSDFLG